MDKVEEVAKACQQKEGYFKPGEKSDFPDGSYSYICNNPGNILYNDFTKSLGATSSFRGKRLTYAVFPTYEVGFYALKVFLMLGFSGQLKSYKPNMTLKEFFKVYSGGGTTYGQFVSDKTGIPAETPVGKIYDNEWNPETVNKIPVEYYYQRNARYKNAKLGNSNLCFQINGCFTCCLAYMKGEDPLAVMEKLKKGGGYNGAMIVSNKAAEILGLELLKGDDKYIPGKMNNIDYMPDWSPTIKEVWLGKSQHFVVRLIRDGKRLIYDPWTGGELPINHYPFKSYRLFKVNN